MMNNFQKSINLVLCLIGSQTTDLFSADGVTELDLLAETNWGYMFDSLEIDWTGTKMCGKFPKIKFCTPVTNQFPITVSSASFDSEFNAVSTFAALLNKVTAPIGKLQAKLIPSPTELDSQSASLEMDDMKYYEVQVLNNTDIFEFLLILEYQKKFDGYLENLSEWALDRVANATGVAKLTDDQMASLKEGIKESTKEGDKTIKQEVVTITERTRSPKGIHHGSSVKTTKISGAEYRKQGGAIGKNQTVRTGMFGRTTVSSAMESVNIGNVVGSEILDFLPIPEEFKQIEEAMEVMTQATEMMESFQQMGSQYSSMATQGNPYYAIYKAVIQTVQKFIARPTSLPVSFPLWNSAVDVYQWRTGKLDELTLDSIISQTAGAIGCDFSYLFEIPGASKLSSITENYCIGGWGTRYKRIGYNHQMDFGRGAGVAVFRGLDWSSTGVTALDTRSIFGIQPLGVKITDKFQLLRPESIEEPFNLGKFNSVLDDVYEESDDGMEPYIFLQWVPMYKCDPCNPPTRQ